MSISGKRFLSESEKNKPKKSILEEDYSLISRMYKDAADKHKQLKILSQLYAKSVEEIAQFLYDHGFNDKYIQKKITK